MLAFGDMMRKGILMPAHLMDDGVHSEANRGRSLFDDYATVAEAAGVYTARDYASIVEHLVARWGVADVQGLRGDAAREQEFLMQVRGVGVGVGVGGWAVVWSVSRVCSCVCARHPRSTLPVSIGWRT